MNAALYTRCKYFDFEKLFKAKGYSYFTKGDYNLNIIGIRSSEKEVTNKYDDCLVLIYHTQAGWRRCIYSITTDPGLKSIKNPINSKGTAILVPGQYKGTYKIDKHKGKYDALCQRNKPVKVYRDGNLDNIYDFNPNSIETGLFGINIHRSSEFAITSKIDGYSAGCQVFSNPKEFRAFMILVKKSARTYGNCFTYTLITEEDLYDQR